MIAQHDGPCNAKLLTNAMHKLLAVSAVHMLHGLAQLACHHFCHINSEAAESDM